MGRTAQGVKSMTLSENQKVVSMIVIKKSDENAQVVTLSEYGYGKRNSVSGFRLTGRGTKGVKAGVFTDKTGNLVGLCQVETNQDLMIIADNGVIIRTPVKDVSLIGRNTQGVKIMRLREGSKIVCVATSEHEEEQPEENLIENVIVENIEEKIVQENQGE